MESRLWIQASEASTPADGRGDRSNRMNEMERYEQLAEAAYDAMYDPRPGMVAKMHFEDASMYFFRAAEAARSLGLTEDAVRLEQRRDHVRKVYNSQFRGF